MLLKVLERLVSEMYVELPKSSRHFSNLYILDSSAHIITSLALMPRHLRRWPHILTL